MRTVIVGAEMHVSEITSLNNKGLEIVGFAVRKELKEQVRQSFKVDTYTDYRKLFDEKKPEIVGVANENNQKAEVILEALSRGCHVIVDKPMAMNMKEVESIENMAKKNDLRVLLLLTLRGNGQYRKVKEIVSSGEIGIPMQCYAKMSVELRKETRPAWFLDKRIAGGPILDLAIHSFDIIEWVTGMKFIKVTAYEGNISHPEMPNLLDSGAEIFLMENGGTAVVEQNRVLPPGCGHDYRLDIVGTKGQVNLRKDKYLRVQTSGNQVREFNCDAIAKEMPDFSIVADWLKSLKDNLYQPVLPDEDSFRASKIACLAKESAEDGRTVVIGK